MSISDEHESQWVAINSIAAKIGCTAETLRRWVRQAERDSGLREGQTTPERERIRGLEREVRELRQASADGRDGKDTQLWRQTLEIFESRLDAH